MIGKIDIDMWRSVYPFFIYQQVALLPGHRGTLLFTIPQDYWYLMRRIICKAPELDAAGATFNPGLFIEIRGSSRHRDYQNAPIPIRHLSTPGQGGIQVTVAGQLTAAQPSSLVLIDEILPQYDNIEMYFSGNDVTPFPAFIDVVLTGHMVPDRYLSQWCGSNV